MGNLRPTNIQFNYLYRDAGNYKVYGYIVLSNPTNRSLDELDLEIKKHLISEQYFDPDKVGIPRLQHKRWNSELDHTWNEYSCIEYTSETAGISLTIDFLLEKLKLLQENSVPVKLKKSWVRMIFRRHCD